MLTFKVQTSWCKNKKVKTTKYKLTHRAFMEVFKKELAELLFKPMDAQELQDPEKKSPI